MSAVPSADLTHEVRTPRGVEPVKNFRYCYLPGEVVTTTRGDLCTDDLLYDEVTGPGSTYLQLIDPSDGVVIKQSAVVYQLKRFF